MRQHFCGYNDKEIESFRVPPTDDKWLGIPCPKNQDPKSEDHQLIESVRKKVCRYKMYHLHDLDSFLIKQY